MIHSSVATEADFTFGREQTLLPCTGNKVKQTLVNVILITEVEATWKKKKKKKPDEIVLGRALERIKKLMLEASGKNLTTDLDIVSRLQESFREIVKAHPGEGNNFTENLLRHLMIGTGFFL